MNLPKLFKVEALVADGTLDGLCLQLARLRRVLLKPLELLVGQLGLVPLRVGGHLPSGVRGYRDLSTRRRLELEKVHY